MGNQVDHYNLHPITMVEVLMVQAVQAMITNLPTDNKSLDIYMVETPLLQLIPHMDNQLKM